MNGWFSVFWNLVLDKKGGEEGKNVLLDLSQVDNVINKAF